MRSEQQVALQSIAVELQASAEHLARAQEYLSVESGCGVIKALEKERRAYCERLHDTLRAMDDRPDIADPDRVTVTELGRKFQAWLSLESTEAEYLRRLTSAQSELNESLKQHGSAVNDAYQDLIRDIEKHVRRSETLLGDLAARQD